MKLIDLRIKANLKRKEVAKAAGISESYYCLLEKNKRTNPSIEVIKKLAYVFGVDVKVVFDIFLRLKSTDSKEMAS